MRKILGPCLLAVAPGCAQGSGSDVGFLPPADPALAEARWIAARHSLDGARVAGLAPDGGGSERGRLGYRLVVADADGAHELRLGQAVHYAAGGLGPGWSPDGRTLAIVESEGQEPYESRSLKLFASNGSSERTVAPLEAELFRNAPVWSPDGAWVGLASIDTGVARARLWQVEGGRSLELTVADTRHGWAAMGFSPDGRRVALLARQALYVFDLPGEDSRDTPEPSARFDLAPWTSESVREPRFLDGGRRVLCVAGDGLWIVDLERKAVDRHLSEHEVIDAVVTPDGRELVAVVEEKVEPNVVVGVVETLATAGHPADRYARTAWRAPLDGTPPQPLPATRAVSQRHSFEYELGLAPSVRQALSRWR